jgi:general secretion pathway protein F
MPLFRYRALSSDGKTIKGLIDADSFLVAKERLRRQQLLVTEVIAHKASQKELTIPLTFILTFTRELAHLLRAGLPLYESLITIEEKYLRHKAHPMLLDFCDHLKEGHSFSVALKRYPKIFNQIYLSMVQVAEQSGNLEVVFDQLAQLIARQMKLKKQITASLAYPCLLGVFCFCVASGLLLFVVPSMKELFEGRSLHPMTALVISLSNWINAHIQFLLCSFLTGICAFTYLWRKASGKVLVFRICLKLPFIKSLLLQAALVRFCRALAMLLQAGVPLLEALRLVKNVIKNPLLEQGITEAEAKIIRGERLSHALKAIPLMPALVVRLIALAEETGKMQEACNHLADIYEEEVEKYLAQLTTFLQPALLITLGAVVGLVVLSILLPLTDVSSFLST